MTWLIVSMWSTPKSKWTFKSYRIGCGYVTKTRQNNDTTNRIGAVYTENEIKMLWLIGPGVVCDENQAEQQLDRSYRYGLRWKQN